MLGDGAFPEDWKKSNVVLVYKKYCKNLIKSYRPISSLPMFSEVIERLTYNSMFNYFMEKKLFAESQSGFIPGVSCVAHLLSITHEIHNSVDCNPPFDIKEIFLDICKAFDKVWHEVLIFR